MAISIHLKRIAQKRLQPKHGHFDSSPITVLDGFLLNKAILIFYWVKKPFSLGAALLDKTDLHTLLWKTVNPIWQTEEKIKPLKITKRKYNIFFSFISKNKPKCVQISLDSIFEPRKKIQKVLLKRAEKNPILRPNPNNAWEAYAIYNAAALYLEDKVHLVYRTIISTGESVLGYATSKDGIHIDYRSNKPIYCCEVNREKFSDNRFSLPYGSGGSWSGCEDPRLTCIEDTIYMTYTVFNGFHPPYMALTSIKVCDFLNKQWNWKNAIRISSMYEMHKNWVVFPEKINGKFAILHSLTPKILVDYFDSLDEENIYVKSHYNPEDRSIYWDNWMRGAGPPPIKTKEGWLLLYHAMDCNDPDKYKIGALILDLNDPTKIRYRSAYPILEPQAHYEMEGLKSGVVYSCGTALIDETFFVYYGAADTVLCTAHANLDHLLTGIKNSRAPALRTFLSRG